MKYSFMSFSTPDLTLADILEVAKRYGYDGIEPRIDSGHKHGLEVTTSPGQRDELRQCAIDSGIKLACIATSLKYADPEQQDEVLKQTRERIDLASDMGIPAMRIFGGGIPENISREQGIDLLVDSLSLVADYASEHDVTLCLETHDDWCDPEHVAAVLKRVNHSAICVNWDAMHPVRTGNATIDESFEILKPWIRHVHVHDGITEDDVLRMVPFGEGEINHKRVINLLLSMGYDGYISGEWINWESYETHLPRELATLKHYEDEAL